MATALGPAERGRPWALLKDGSRAGSDTPVGLVAVISAKLRLLLGIGNKKRNVVRVAANDKIMDGKIIRMAFMISSADVALSEN